MERRRLTPVGAAAYETAKGVARPTAAGRRRPGKRVGRAPAVRGDAKPSFTKIRKRGARMALPWSRRTAGNLILRVGLLERNSVIGFRSDRPARTLGPIVPGQRSQCNEVA